MISANRSRSFRERIIGAGVWVLGGHLSSQLLRLGSNLIMTRLLVPEMFGVMAVANVLIMGLVMLSDLGLRQNIIQSHRGNDPDFLNTAWTVQILRGLLLWFIALGFVAANAWIKNMQILPADSVYAEPVLPYVIAALSFIALISGFESTKLATANRNLSMNLIIKIEIISQIVGIAVMILWALIDRSIWALVAGAIISKLVRVVQSHLLLPGPANSLHLDKHNFREIFHFGKWVFLSSILGFLANNGDRLMLGGLVNSTILGQYAIAIFIVQSLQQIIGKVVSSVALPALSEVARKQPEQISGTYYKFRTIVDSFSLITLGIIFLNGQHIVDILYDSRYQQAGFMLEVSCLGLFMGRYTLVNQCFISMGKPRLLIPIIGIRMIALFTLIPIAFSYFGMEGVLWAIVASGFIALPIILFLKARHRMLSISREIKLLGFLILGLLSGWVINNLIVFAYSVM